MNTLSRITRFIGSKPVAVLALFSYAKFLIPSLLHCLSPSWTTLMRCWVAVWQYDGNILYVHLWHVALLSFLVLFLPYTLLFTVEQWLQAKSFFHWINKPRIKPFMDAYWAPYREHCNGIGLTHFLLCVLFAVCCDFSCACWPHL